MYLIENLEVTMLLSKSSGFPPGFSSYIIIPREVSVSLFYTKLFQSLIQVHLFARDAHPRITSANVLYINLKITLAKFLRSTNVKQRQTLPNIKLAADKFFLLILAALIDIFYTFAPAYISCKEIVRFAQQFKDFIPP